MPHVPSIRWCARRCHIIALFHTRRVAFGFPTAIINAFSAPPPPPCMEITRLRPPSGFPGNFHFKRASQRHSALMIFALISSRRGSRIRSECSAANKVKNFLTLYLRKWYRCKRLIVKRSSFIGRNLQELCKSCATASLGSARIVTNCSCASEVTGAFATLNPSWSISIWNFLPLGTGTDKWSLASKRHLYSVHER